jgi:hypothetical protein
MRGDKMIKFDTNSVSLNSTSRSFNDLGSAGRFIVLVPEDADYTFVTRRVWELTHAFGCDICFLSLCSDAAQEASLHRQLITMAAMIHDGKLYAETCVEIGSNWVRAIRAHLQDGDTIICFAEQRVGLVHRPISQILNARLDVPIYILSGLSSPPSARSGCLTQALAWAGSMGIIAGAFFFQIRIMSISENWAQTTLLILSVIGEIWLILGWNNLLS